MIRTILRLQVAPGAENDLVASFKKHQILETSIAQPGCLSAELAIGEHGDEAIVTATWDDEAAYREWTQRADRGSLSDELSTFLTRPITAETVGAVYRIAHRPPPLP
jgi:heme-degrading monooxygenase HmoA